LSSIASSEVNLVTLSSLSLAILLATADAATTGDQATGRALFIGARPFQNGGAPCGACHALGNQGLAFQATLGPELSAALAGMDPVALDGLLDALPFPTMVPVYEGHLLTTAERAHLVAFLVPATQQGPPRDGWHVEALGLLGAAGLFLLVAIAARGRKPPSRARLLARAHLVKGASR
jgi:hypothetical protein